MKKYLYYAGAVLLTVSFLTACTKESEMPQNDKEQTSDPALPAEPTSVMTVNIPQDLTKVSLNQDSDPDGAVLLAWENDDVIRIIDHNDPANCQDFSICDGFTAHSASFEGTPVTAESYDILYGALNVSAAETEVFGNQVQSENGSTAHLQWMALLSGVDTYNAVEFSQEWAVAHGGTFKQNGVLRVRLQLPENVKTVKSITVTAPESVFYTTNALDQTSDSMTLTFATPADVSADQIISAYMMLPWADVKLSDNSDLVVSFTTGDNDLYSRNDVPAGGATLYTGKVNAIKLPCSTPGENVVLEDFAGGKGSAESPWLIGNVRQMQNIHASLVSGEKKYFKMIDDVDLQGIKWTPLNKESPYDKAIDFDGDSKKILNLTCTAATCPSFLGVLNGDIRNVTFKDAAVGLATVGYVGIVAGGVNAAEPVGSVSNVVIDGCTVTAKNIAGAIVGCAGTTSFTDCQVVNTTLSAATGASVGCICGFSAGEVNFVRCSVTNDNGVGVTAGQYVGGIVGRATAGGSISNCSVAVPVGGTANVGGLVGAAQTKSISVSNSNMVADVTGAGNNCGGLVGLMQVEGSSISNSYMEGDVTLASGGYAGGILGNMANSSISNCYATGNVSSTTGSLVGGLIGNMSGGSVSNCYATGNVSSANAKIGGLIGEQVGGTCKCCYASGSVSGKLGQVGGVLGQGNTTPTIEKCVAWNSSISVTDNGQTRYSCAAVVGTMFPLGIAKDCVRIPGLTISGMYEETDQSSAIYHMNGVFDQDNITTDSPLKNNNGESVTSTKIGSPYKFPYHGKVAASDETLSDVAKRLGWDQTIWNCSGATPTLNIQ